MNKLGEFYDDILGEETYTLYTCKLSEIKQMVQSVIVSKGPFKISDFDDGCETQHLVKDDSMKLPSFYHNNFIVVQGLEDGSPWLLDGFSRLFVVVNSVEDYNVFVKSYSKKMGDDKVLKLLSSLNFWKSKEYLYKMFDRGFILYTYMKTGYNIKKHLKNISLYLDIRSYDFSEASKVKYAKMRKDALSNNSQFFSDVVTMCKLQDVCFDPHELLEKRRQKQEYVKKDLVSLEFVVPFHRILRDLRIVNTVESTSYTIDLKEASEWLLNNPELRQLAVEKVHGSTSVSEVNTINKSYDIFWNKYVLPKVMGKEAKKTEEELKADFRKNVNKEKAKYVKTTYEELKNMPIGTEVCLMDVYYPNISIRKKTFLGTKFETFVYTPKVGLMSDRKPRNIEHEIFMFKKEDGQIEEDTLTLTHTSDYKERFVLIEKVKK